MAVLPIMLIVFNPAAGKRRAALLWRVVDIMALHGLKVDVAATACPGDGTRLARMAAERGARLVVAAGGDGTVAEVAGGLAGSDCRLGVIPLGSGNVLARELGLPAAPEALASALAFGRTRRVWPGLVRRNGPGRLPTETVFVQMMGAGFDAQVVHRLPTPLKRALGPAAYLAQGVRELGRYDFAPMRVRVDGQPMRLAGVLVTKTRLGSGHHLSPIAPAPDRPGFTVAAFEHAGAWTALLHGAAMPLRWIGRVPGLRLLPAARIEIETDHVPAQADGDPAGVAPLTVTDARHTLEVMVS